MERRRYLATVVSGIAGGLAGCIGYGNRSNTDPSSTPIKGVQNAPSTLSSDKTPPDVCAKSLRPDLIPAITDPAFAPNWDDLSNETPSRTIQRRQWTLTESSPVIGIDRAGETRAYPLSVLSLSEIVNDSFDVPVLVTYCSLCASGLTAIRRVDGQETLFGNAGFTWKPPDAVAKTAIQTDRVFGISDRNHPAQTTPTVDQNQVLFDRKTGSLWSQLLARAICGPQTDEMLSLLPSTVTKWGDWQRKHPETTVLLPPPYSTTWVRGVTPTTGSGHDTEPNDQLAE